MKPEPLNHLLDVKPYVAGKRDATQANPVKLSSNENPYGASPKAIEAYTQAAKELHRYGDSHCTQLREAIAEVQDLPADQIVIGAGSDELISLLIGAYAGGEHEVLCTKHSFAMYRIYSQVAGTHYVDVEESDLTADVDKILAALTPRTKIVFLANPNNPTGTYLPPSEVKRLHQGLPQEVLLVLDGAYTELVEAEDYTDGRELVEHHENVVILHTFSKVYGLPSLRVGWMYAAPAVVDIINRARSPFNVNGAAQAAAAAAMRDQGFLQDCVQKNAQQRARLTQALRGLGFPVVPSQGNFVLMHCGDHASALNAYLLEKNVIVREMGGYFLPEYLRISIGTEAENTAFLNAVEEFAKQANVASAV